MAAPGCAGARLRPFGHAHHDDDPEVEEDRHDARQHADDREPVVPFLDRGAEDVPLADEAGRWWEAAERQQEHGHQPRQRRPRLPQTGEITQLVVLVLRSAQERDDAEGPELVTA